MPLVQQRHVAATIVFFPPRRSESEMDVHEAHWMLKHGGLHGHDSAMISGMKCTRVFNLSTPSPPQSGLRPPCLDFTIPPSQREYPVVSIIVPQ